jgi:AcrR family transcriptional regulator
VTAPYLRIVAEIRDRIERGDLAPGDPVPSARQITRDWGVAIATATKVLTTLRHEGLVRAVPGVGTLVRQPAVRQPARRVPDSPPPHRPTRHPSTTRAPLAEGDELSVGRIVWAGIALADAEGLPALSMRRVAGALGVATMSLYRHVPHKEELVLLMADAAFGERPPPARRVGDWRAQLDREARVQWAGYKRHRWLAQVVSLTRPQVLPNGIAHTEWTLGAFDGLGLDPTTALHATVTLFGYVRGIALNLETQARDEQDSGVTDDEWMRSQDGVFAEIFADRFPRLAALLTGPIALDLESLFDFGLHRLLDGYATLLTPSPSA